MRIALATCVDLPEPDPDAPLLDAALRAEGASPALVPWDDPGADAGAFDLVVLRSTWNYYADVDRFLRWVDATAATTRLLNPAHVVRTNARKSYLFDLEARGLPIVPTERVPQGATARLAEIASRRGWKAVVVKPMVSAASFRTARFAADAFEAGDRFLAELAADRDALVQPWMGGVETHGERSLVWIDGELTHAVRKAPRFAGAAEAVSSGPVPIAEDEAAFAARALEASGFAGDVLYARIDVVRDDRGALRLMELELVEPSLFLAQHRAALERFARAIVRRARDDG